MTSSVEKKYNTVMKKKRTRQTYLQVTCTMASAEEAERIARAIVERRLAACAQIIAPVTSVYWWRGAIERSTEWLCVMKTTAETFEALRTAIRELHSYETPEIIATTISAGDAKYLTWLDEEVGGA